jgi:hypothetical protein
MIIPLVGCSKKDDTATPTVVIQTPLQILQARANASDSTNARQDQTDIDLSNRITTEIATVSHYDDAPIIARLVALEGLNVSTIAAQIAFLNLWIQDYESDNISTRLSVVEARLVATPTPTVNATPTPTANVTPTPVPMGLLTKPIAYSPAIGNVSVVNGSVLFQWSDCNASLYEFWFGNNSNNLELWDTLDSDVQSFLWVAPEPNTYYFWRIRAVVGTTVKSSSFWFKTSP